MGHQGLFAIVTLWFWCCMPSFACAQKSNIGERVLCEVPIGIVVKYTQPDGQQFIAKNEIGKYQHWANCQPKGPLYDSVVSPSVNTTDGSHMAYLAMVGTKGLVVVDGKPGPMYDNVGEPRISADGQHVMYDASKGRKQITIVDGKETPAKSILDKDVPVVELDGQYFVSADLIGGRSISLVMQIADYHGKYSNPMRAVLSKKGKKYIMILDGKAGPSFDDVGEGIFSPDAKHVAYWASQAGKEFVVLDGKIGRGYDHVYWPSFESDGKVLKYIALDGRKLLQVTESVDRKHNE